MRSSTRTPWTAKITEVFLPLAVAAMLFLSGCASISTFSSHPSRINPLISSLQSGQPLDLSRCLLTECQSSDAMLYQMERGRFAQIVGNLDISMHDYSAAMERIGESDRKPRISLSDLGANLAAAAVNDNAVPYAGAGYERVMLHHYQALNYLAKKDLEGAGVEVRRANAEQEDALRRHEEEVELAQKEASEAKVADALQNPALVTAYAQMDEVAGQVKNSFQNAYTFYLSGFIYEALHQPDDAYVDYKRALEIYPENSFLQRDVLRLAQELGMSEDLEELRARFPVEEDTLPAEGGDLLVIFEDGFVPQKQEVKLALPFPGVGLLAVAFPVYREEWSRNRPLDIEADGEALGATEPICDFRALSVKALKEQVPVLMTRQLVRVVAKGAATIKAREKLGPLGELGMSVWNIVSENADLRSWVSLPANAQVLRVALPPGRHTLTLRQEGQPVPMTVEVTIAQGSRNLLHVVRAGQEFYTSAVAATDGSGVRGEKASAADHLTQLQQDSPPHPAVPPLEVGR